MGALKMPGSRSGKESEEEVRVNSTVDIRVLTGNSPTWYHLVLPGSPKLIHTVCFKSHAGISRTRLLWVYATSRTLPLFM